MSSLTSKPKEFLNKPLRLAIIWSCVVLFAFYVWSATQARKNTSNRVVDWLPRGTHELRIYFDRYYHHFPEGGLLMVSWAGCDETDIRLDDIAARLTAPREDGGAAYFERCLTTRSVLEELTEPPSDLTEEEAREHLSGWLIGRNGRDACLIALISEQGKIRRDAAIEQVFATVESIVGLPRSEIYVAGPTIDSVAIDEISKRAQATLLPFFLVLCLLLLLCCLRNFFAALVVFGIAQMNEELAGTLLYWTGAHVDSISMLISSLVYVLTISAGVHLVNYYRETLQESDVTTAPRKMVAKAALPCTLAALTTILGMGSLTVSKMVPIRTFGIYASLALMIGIAWLFFVVTAVFQQYPIRQWVRRNDGKARPRPTGQRWERFGNLVRRHRTVIALTSIFSMVFLAFGVKNLKTTVTFHGMLPDSAKVIRDYDTLESRIGGLIPIEVVLEVPDAGNEDLLLVDQLYLLRALKRALKPVEEVEVVVSALNFAPELPPASSRATSDAARRRAMNRILGQNLDTLENTRFYCRAEVGKTDHFGGTYDVNSTFWRMSLRIASRTKVDYDPLLREIRQRLNATLQSERGRMFQGPRIDVTGSVPLVHRAQQQLLDDLVESFITAFGLIALTMILMLGGIVRGLLAMVPNLFPCVVVFGVLGWMDIPIDMGSMMTASVAMGIAVDGTLHYLTWFKTGMHRGLDRSQAGIFAYRRCATALLQTTIICGFGMLVFSQSDFVPVSRFAVMMCLLLTMALIGDIVVLPAILFGPLGRFFEPGSYEFWDVVRELWCKSYKRFFPGKGIAAPTEEKRELPEPWKSQPSQAPEPQGREAPTWNG